MRTKIATKSIHKTYDIILVGGGIMGASSAWFLSKNSDFSGRILVIEKDFSYKFSSTSHTNSCLRQQFSSALNIRISQFAADFIKNFKKYMGKDSCVPEIKLQNFGYMYLAQTQEMADTLQENYEVQVANGAGTKLLAPEEISKAYPFYFLDDIILGSHNKIDEGYWDSWTVFEWLRRSSRHMGVEYIQNEAVAINLGSKGKKVLSVTLRTGEKVSCEYLVNASGTRAIETAKMAGIKIPVEPRKRYSWVFSAESPLDRELPLTIDPSGIHFRSDGPKTYLAGGIGDVDPKVDYTDFAMESDLWLNKVWPVILHRIPQFSALKIINEWVGHYAYNYFDQNAIVGAHSYVSNFIFLNGFSGHGLQQAPAMGRAISELLVYGEYRSLDMSPFSYHRIERGEKFIEKAII